MSTAGYDRIGRAYSAHRRADPRISAAIIKALGGAQRVLDVGAGTGSYEPSDRFVVAAEPSSVMLAQRRSGDIRPADAVQAVAEELPFPDNAFDAVMAVLTVHHWADRRRGLAELRRVAPRRVVLTFDVALHNSLWLLSDYLPSVAEAEAGRCPSLDEVASGIGADRAWVVPIPHDCADGMTSAYWRRPHAYLDPAVRAYCSGLARADQAVVEAGIDRLQDDLWTGRWRKRYGHLLDLDVMDYGYRLLIAG